MPKTAAPTKAVYAIKCQDGRAYVGGSVDMQDRWWNHSSTLNRGVHRNRHLQAAWSAMGPGAFEFVCLEVVGDDEDLTVAEQRWMDTLREQGELFNLAPQAGATAGVVHTAETREKMGAPKRGRTLTAEHRAKVSVAGKGRIFSDEHRARIGEANRRRRQSAETRAKISASRRARNNSSLEKSSLT